METRRELTEMLAAWNEGDKEALDKLMPFVAQELRRLAHAQMRREAANHTLQTSALINEAYLKLVEQKNVRWESRSHFLSIAAKLMRRILLDYAKTKLRDKRGAGAAHVELDDAAQALSNEKSREVIALNDALDELAKVDLLKSRIVELRYFGGLSVEETAEALKVSPITVMRHWNLAKAWLKCEIASLEAEKRFKAIFGYFGEI